VPWPKGVKSGRKPKLSDYQRKEALKRRAAGDETLAEIAKSYAVDISMISRELMEPVDSNAETRGQTGYVNACAASPWERLRILGNRPVSTR
jgi:hypothetical protein